MKIRAVRPTCRTHPGHGIEADFAPKRGNLLHKCHAFGVRARFVNVWSN